MDLRRLVAPSLADWLFAAVLAWIFLGANGMGALLADGDTGWHIRTGEYILATGGVPHQDLYSFSKSGQPWYAWEWGSDVLFALAHRAMGLGGVALLAGVVIALCFLVLFRHLLWRGADFFTALAVCLLAGGASSIHFLARPHVFSLLLVAVSFWMIDRDRARPTRALWLLVPLTVLWTNLHGGFVALLVALVAYAAGDLVARSWKSAARYGAVLAGCIAATLANPYGLALHRHMADYLSSDWIRSAVDEFQSPKFRSESSVDFELLLAGAILAAAGLARRRKYGEILLIVGWAHAALVSVRHVPVFAIAAAPAIAEGASGLWREWAGGLGARSPARVLARMAAEFVPAARRTSLWPALLVVALALAPLPRPRDFPEAKFPVALVASHPELAEGRIFTSDQWADYVIYRFSGRARVFIDGRSDFYGEALGKLYLGLISGLPDWHKTLEKQGITHIVAHRDWPLASLLRESPGWRLVDQHGTAMLFVPDAAARLKKTPQTTEIRNGGGASETNKTETAKTPGTG